MVHGVKELDMTEHTHAYILYIYRGFLGIPGVAMVRTRHFHCWGPYLIPDPVTKIPLAHWYGQNKQTEGIVLTISKRNMCQIFLLDDINYVLDIVI